MVVSVVLDRDTPVCFLTYVVGGSCDQGSIMTSWAPFSMQKMLKVIFYDCVDITF